MYFDSNGYTCGKTDADNDGSEVTFFDATPEGWILARIFHDISGNGKRQHTKIHIDGF